MGSVLNRFRKRNIQTNFYQFVLVIFVIAVSVCLIVGLFINYLTLNGAVQRFFRQSNLPNLWVEANQITKEDESFFASRFVFDKRYKFENKFVSGSSEYSGTILVSNGETSTPYIVEGEKEKGCYVDARFAKEHNFGLNHSKLAFDYELNGETKRISFKIVGFISLAEEIVADGEAVIFIDENVFLETLKAYFNNIDDSDLSIIGYNEILITSEVSEEDKQDIQTYYESSSSKLKALQSIESHESVVEMKKEIDIARNMLWIFPIIFVVISTLVVVSAISQLVLKERYNIGLLKSLGISNKQILSNYCGYGMIICVIGAVLGLVISPLIIPNMTFETYDLLFNLPRDEVKLTCSVKLVIIVIFASILMGYFSSLFVSLNLINKTPKECMSKFSKISLKSRKKKKNISVIISAPLRNMKNNLTRTIMSVVGISGSSLLILIGFGIEKVLLKNSDKKDYFSINTFSSIFKGFSILLISLTIVILISQIFKERQKEMTILRIHGESYVKIWVSILLEMLFIGVIGFLISIILSGPTMLLNLYIFGINEYYAINFLSYLKTFLIVLSMIILSSGIGLVKIYKLRLSDAIKFSE